MAADPMVTHFNYPIDGSRKPFPFNVFMPYHDEPLHLVEALRDQAAVILNTERVSILANVGSIKETHAKIAEIAKTDMVMVLDADLALGEGPFQMFPAELFGDEDQFVHLWHVRNPINHLEYGHGGPKLFNREQLLTANTLEGVDMTTAFDKGLCIHTEVVGTHAFNWSAGSTWRTAFREAAKLTHQVAKSSSDSDEHEEAKYRLTTWLTTADDNAEYSEFCLVGARDGHQFAQKADSLSQINDYSWLYEQFKQQFPNDY